MQVDRSLLNQHVQFYRFINVYIYTSKYNHLSINKSLEELNGRILYMHISIPYYDNAKSEVFSPQSLVKCPTVSLTRRVKPWSLNCCCCSEPSLALL